MQQRPSPTLNGRVYDWASISVSQFIHDGPQIDISDVSGVSYERGQEISRARGIGHKYLGSTGGRPTDPTASLTFYAHGRDAFEASLIAVAESLGYVREDGVVVTGDVSFDLTYSRSMNGNPDIAQTMLKGCRVLSESGSFSEGTDPLTIEVPLFVAEILSRPNQQSNWSVVK